MDELVEKLARTEIEIAYQYHSMIVLGRKLTSDELGKAVDRHIAALLVIDTT